jgi:hypothetical protein
VGSDSVPADRKEAWAFFKNLARIGKEAGLFQKSWYEFAKKLDFRENRNVLRQESELSEKISLSAGLLLSDLQRIVSGRR